MPKTLVNIITEDEPIANYLFVREMYQDGDSLMFISAKDTEDDLDFLSSIWQVPTENIEEILLRGNNDEDAYELICRNVITHLHNNVNYCVNLAGGTRYMAIAVQQVFEKFNAKYFYVNVEDNKIIQTVYNDSIYDNDDYTCPILHKMSVPEYLTLHDMQHDIDSEHRHTPYCSAKTAADCFRLFSSQTVPGFCFDVLKKLRNGYRNAKSADDKRTLSVIKRKYEVSISEIQRPHNPNWVAIPYLTDFLSTLGFSTRKPGNINKDEIDFLTGGWLEQYVYYWVLKKVHPDDIQLGVHIWKKDVPNHDNELDVIFTKNNHLYVIECKTGVDNDRLFNDIVYKVCALKEALLGMSCHSFIVSLKKDNLQDGLKKVANSMEVTFIDHAMLVRPTKLLALITKLAK